MRKNWILIVAFLLTACGGGGSEPPKAVAQVTPTTPLVVQTKPEDDFIRVKDGDFYLNGKVFKFGGNVADWIHRVDTPSIDNAFKDYSELNLKVIRIWAYTDIGSIDNTVPNLYKDWQWSVQTAPYFQYWDTNTNSVKVNEAGIKNLDRLLDSARRNNFKVIMTLTNNWANGGGVDQYNVWFKSKYHDDFYTKPEIKSAFKNWISTLVNRTNTLNGKKYKDDPTIFSWELGNELFCFTDNYSWRAVAFLRSPSCNSKTITSWADEMSSYIKSIDPNHLVSMGNIGFLNRNKNYHYITNEGDDFEETIALPNIDFGTFHIYMDEKPYYLDYDFATTWIKEHVDIANKFKKPIVMEEFGHKLPESRDQAITHMLETFTKLGGDGWLVYNVPVMILPWNTPLGGEGFQDYAITKNSSAGAILKRYAEMISR